jgi:preprotein translocase subunit SecG
MKIDKEALAKAVGVMLLSWAALPIVYYLIVRKKKDMEEVKEEVKEEGKDNVY